MSFKRRVLIEFLNTVNSFYSYLFRREEEGEEEIGKRKKN